MMEETDGNGEVHKRVTNTPQTCLWLIENFVATRKFVIVCSGYVSTRQVINLNHNFWYCTAVQEPDFQNYTINVCVWVRRALRVNVFK